MDRSWMYKQELGEEYIAGVKEFCRVARQNIKPEDSGYMLCPCRKCSNDLKYDSTHTIFDHLTRYGFMENYTVWKWHGESSNNVRMPHICQSQPDIQPDVENLTVGGSDSELSEADEDQIDEMLQDVEQHYSGKPGAYENLKESAKTPLYPGCDVLKLNKLNVALKLLNLKATYGWSDVSFTALLELLKDVLPESNELPISTYHAKKLLCPMGIGYQKIHACVNGCILYWKDNEDAVSCSECGESRYLKKRDKDSGVVTTKVPAKVLWYLPIIPRFKRLFAVEKDAKNLRWHATRKKDEKLRHPADSPQWRNIDRTFVQFGRDARNLRLGLCTDGMNPYGTLSSIHSTWPVLLTIYNLPSWLCMKPRNIMLTLLISGPKQPGNKIDVFLAPLIEDLQLLWNEGTMVYDSFAKENFNLRAMLFCTINDFPAYSNLSGYTCKGAKACPICEDDSVDLRLKHCGKNVYLGNRRFLPIGHRYRKMTKQFNGKTEYSVTRFPLSGTAVFKRVKDIVNNFGPPLKRPVKCIWKKKSVFWELEYWKHLQVRHCLDGMHIEKNVGESLIGTLLNIKGKTKDHVKARKDLVELGIRAELAPQERGKRIFLPPACHTLSKQEKRSLCSSLYNTKVPTGYSSNIRSLVSMSDLKLVGMKSHDYRVLMQYLLPVAIRGILPVDVRKTITNLCYFFKAISAKVLDVETLEKLQADVVVTLCQLEMYFPPSFFDIMVHLVVHLVREIKECGPMYLRYMYPFERYMGILKKKMKNRRCPEGSIIEGVTTEEAVDFCTHYLEGIDFIGLPRDRHDGRIMGVGVKGKRMYKPDIELLNKAHLLVLKHLEVVEPYFEEHMTLLRQRNPTMGNVRLIKEQNRTFIEWLKERVFSEESGNIPQLLQWLASGPALDVASYEGYDINGFTFYTLRQDSKSTVQNSGINVVATQELYQGARDHAPIIDIKQYHGVIHDIWVLDYTQYEICLFRCEWVDNKHGCYVDEFGMTLVDLSRTTSTDDPFVVATDAKQVFYVSDPSNSKWSIVLQGKRCMLDVDKDIDEDDSELVEEAPPTLVTSPHTSGEDNSHDNMTAQYIQSNHDEGLWIQK